MISSAFFASGVAAALHEMVATQTNQIKILTDKIKQQDRELESLRADLVMARHDGYVRGLTEAQITKHDAPK